MTLKLGGTLIALVLLAGCESATDTGGNSVDDEYTCEDLAEEAYAIEGSTGVSLIKVRQPNLVKDNRTTYTVPAGTGAALVMQCRGAGVFSNGMEADVKLTVTVDADEDMFVAWEPVL